MTDWTRQSDGELLRHIQHGVGEALAEFYRRFAHPLRVFLARRVREHDEVDDLLQETMMAAVTAIMRFRGNSAVFTWLCGIARHKLLDHYGLRAKAPVPAEVETRQSEDNAVDRLCESELVQTALARLPQEYRMAMELRYLDELPVAVVAGRMGRTLKSVESMLVRARKLFTREYAAMQQEVERIG